MSTRSPSDELVGGSGAKYSAGCIVVGETFIAARSVATSTAAGCRASKEKSRNMAAMAGVSSDVRFETAMRWTAWWERRCGLVDGRCLRQTGKQTSKQTAAAGSQRQRRHGGVVIKGIKHRLAAAS